MLKYNSGRVSGPGVLCWRPGPIRCSIRGLQFVCIKAVKPNYSSGLRVVWNCRFCSETTFRACPMGLLRFGLTDMMKTHKSDVFFCSNSVLCVSSSRPRQVRCDWRQRHSSKWQREENSQASDHLLQSAAAGSAPTLPADTVSGLTGARRPCGKAGAHTNSGSP